MKKVDRLIIKAKKKCGYERLAVAFIYPSEEEPVNGLQGVIFGTEKRAAV